MENGSVTADGTKILTVEEYDRFTTAIPESMKAILRLTLLQAFDILSFKDSMKILNGTGGHVMNEIKSYAKSFNRSLLT
jgi:hypothetical protein